MLSNSRGEFKACLKDSSREAKQSKGNVSVVVLVLRIDQPGSINLGLNLKKRKRYKKHPSIQTLCSAIQGGSSKRVKRTVVEKQSKVKAMSVCLVLLLILCR